MKLLPLFCFTYNTNQHFSFIAAIGQISYSVRRNYLCNCCNSVNLGLYSPDISRTTAQTFSAHLYYFSTFRHVAGNQV